MAERMLEGIEVKLNTDYLADCEHWNSVAEKIIYTGYIDACFGYRLGCLDRRVRFESKTLDFSNFQGNATVNYTGVETPWN